MKKITIFTAISVALLVTFAIVGMAFAQTQSPPQPEQPNQGMQPWGPGEGAMNFRGGMMNGRWNRGAGMGLPGSYGPMHETMISALAEALNLTPEELEARRTAGETMGDIAQEQGLTAEAFQEIMLEARSKALSQAVADGLITQAQADWMQERMNGMWSGGYGVGSSGCTGMGSGFQGRNGGWRWNK